MGLNALDYIKTKSFTLVFMNYRCAWYLVEKQDCLDKMHNYLHVDGGMYAGMVEGPGAWFERADKALHLLFKNFPNAQVNVEYR